MTKLPYSYDELFPERWLHAPDLAGRTVTLQITEAYAEYIQNPKKHKKGDPGDLCGIVAFRGTQREYLLNKVNAWVLKTLWGTDPAAYVGKHITLAPVADGSGFTEHNTRIQFVGSPDIDGDRIFTLPGGAKLTFRKTVANHTTVTEASADPVTGEVSDTAPEPRQDAPSPSSDVLGDSTPAEALASAVAVRRVKAEFTRLKMNKPDQLDALKEYGVSDPAELVASAADELIGLLAIMTPEDAAMGQGELA